jgi:hypothetical protein
MKAYRGRRCMAPPSALVSCRGCQFWSTVSRRLQNHIRFHPREKQVALKPVEEYIRFRPPLLFMFASPSTVPIPVAARSKVWACWDRMFESRRGHECLFLVSVMCCGGSGLCDGMITRPEESYRMWSVWVCSWSLDNEEVLAHYGLSRHEIKYPFQWEQYQGVQVCGCQTILGQLEWRKLYFHPYSP